MEVSNRGGAALKFIENQNRSSLPGDNAPNGASILFLGAPGAIASQSSLGTSFLPSSTNHLSGKRKGPYRGLLF